PAAWNSSKKAAPRPREPPVMITDRTPPAYVLTTQFGDRCAVSVAVSVASCTRASLHSPAGTRRVPRRERLGSRTEAALREARWRSRPWVWSAWARWGLALSRYWPAVG